ncbi:hypothetical protein A3J61_00035 [Candidatus Nomurabacteria bacterium RIFCSPHIGHO2_02_FULL_38_15]|uniref:Chromosomal replication initiator DnaA C-terminal domain-containing protein n=1 Tax=Candidatus Nomurabacteria bacterium RIFCSPHIGHO2_02_FULL_38_15 TaxID=1801752 RepID=A0A1F6VQB7_9BACT|nr:MAG: hypothetical protein A3J61_00035 [Candidatus Nomurabacteria bacterium RIFCSPHIGHO2_02_FULL_38_15]
MEKLLGLIDEVLEELSAQNIPMYIRITNQKRAANQKSELRKCLETAVELFRIITVETGLTKKQILNPSRKTEIVNLRFAFLVSFSVIYRGINPKFVVTLIGVKDRTRVYYAIKMHAKFMHHMNDNDHNSQVYRRVINRVCEHFSLDEEDFKNLK